MEKIAVIMSSYNGATFIKEQIDSIINQAGVEPYLLVRDDGSSDNTTEILREYQDKFSNILVVAGDNAGCKKSFYLAAKQAFHEFPRIQYFAFSDQDDVWLPDKLASGIENLKKLEQADSRKPYLYFCPPRIVGRELNPIDKEWSSSHVLSFEEACIAQPCAGCTMVFNRKALEMFLLGDPDKMSMHDSWLYKTVLACGGKVCEDSVPHILYRQHGNNVIGTGSFSSRWKRRIDNFTGKSRYRSGQVREILKTYGCHMPESIAESARILSEYRDSGLAGKIRIISSSRFRATKPMHNLLFKIAVIFNRY